MRIIELDTSEYTLSFDLEKTITAINGLILHFNKKHHPMYVKVISKNPGVLDKETLTPSLDDLQSTVTLSAMVLNYVFDPLGVMGDFKIADPENSFKLHGIDVSNFFLSPSMFFKDPIDFLGKRSRDFFNVPPTANTIDTDYRTYEHEVKLDSEVNFTSEDLQ